jgi:hypothetical protein
MMNRHRLCSGRAARQQGLTLVSLVFWAIAFAMVALVTLKVIPTINEYYTISAAVDKAAKAGGSTVQEIRASFERTRQVEYSMTSITGQDLTVTKENERIVVSFAYDKEIELFGPVSLLIKYRGRSK